jgi:hypothetical protein
MSDELPAVRSQILRRYYEDTWNGRGYTAETFAEATFEEFYAIRKFSFPGTTPRRAAANSAIPRFRALVEQLPADPPQRERRLRETFHVERQREVDLRTVLMPADTQQVIVDRVKDARGWNALRGLSQLECVACITVGFTPEVWQGDVIRIDELDVDECGPTVEDLILSAFSAIDLTIFSERAWTSLAAVRAHGSLESLSLSCPLVRDLKRLQGLSLARLSLSRVEPDEELFETLSSLGASLRMVNLSVSSAFPPSKLGSMPHLRSFSVTGFPEYREEWIDFAVAHPQIGFDFPAPPAKPASISVADHYRGVDILRVQKGKKVEFRVEDDLASLRRGYEGSNGDLEDELRPRARKAKQKIRWGSEADTLVAFAQDVAACRWLIDEALGPD